METSITFDFFAPIQSPSIASKNYKRQLFPVHNRKLYITGSSGLLNKHQNGSFRTLSPRDMKHKK